MTGIGLPVGAALCAVALALGACGGGDEETIAGSEYIAQCEAQLGAQQGELISDEQVAEICACTQDKLVEQGLGDRGLDDESLRDEGEKVGRDCALEVLTEDAGGAGAGATTTG